MKKYRTVKTQMGHKFRVELSAEEIKEIVLFRVCICLSPLLMVFVFAIAAGMI